MSYRRLQRSFIFLGRIDKYALSEVVFFDTLNAMLEKAKMTQSKAAFCCPVPAAMQLSACTRCCC